METIKTYLDNMFASFPKSPEVLKAKRELLASMEDRYNELKAEEKTENEAVGIVISQFGNIDELIAELGVSRVESKIPAKFLTDEQVNEYISESRRSGKYIAFGVFLCVFGAALFLGLTALLSHGVGGYVFTDNAASGIGLAALLVLVAPAVGIFISNGARMRQYEEYQRLRLDMPEATRERITRERLNNMPSFTTKIVAGVVLMIVAAGAFLVAMGFISDGEHSATFAVSALVLVCSFAVWLFVSAGTMKSAYDTVLGLEDYSEINKERRSEASDGVTGAIIGAMWPLVVIAFLVWGFVFDGWSISWILFPIAGLLSGAIATIGGAVSRK